MDRVRSFPSRPESVREARQFVERALADAIVDRWIATLLTSELATNAVRHARSAFEVRLSVRDGFVRISVVNDAPELVAAMRHPDEQGGRGLRLVESLSSAWGVETTPADKTVWFELAAAASPAA